MSETLKLLDSEGTTTLLNLMKEEISVKIVSWSLGTDEEIVAMVQAADNGEINLSDYWSVGDERTVSLSAIPKSGTANGVSWSVGESQPAQTVTLVLMHVGGYTLTNNKTCSFVVGLKNCLNTRGYMNNTDTNSGSWSSCKRRPWCNGGFWSAIPETLRPIFKQFAVTTGTYSGYTAGGSNQITNDWFCLAAEKEVFGSKNYSTNNEANALFRFTWYETASNRSKKLGDTGSAYSWWERSPGYSTSKLVCCVSYDGSANHGLASLAYGLAPFGCI